MVEHTIESTAGYRREGLDRFPGGGSGSRGGIPELVTGVSGDTSFPEEAYGTSPWLAGCDSAGWFWEA